MPDLSTWLTKQQASETIGVSSKTVEKLAADGKLQWAKRPQPGSPPQTVYHPDDVKREAEARNPQIAPYVVPTRHSELPEATSRTSLTRPDAPGMKVLFALAEAINEAAFPEK